jgi:hypothetical protein
MKRLPKRLTLHRETVRRLDPSELATAQGGYNYSTGSICPYLNCPSIKKPC